MEVKNPPPGEIYQSVYATAPSATFAERLSVELAARLGAFSIAKSEEGDWAPQFGNGYRVNCTVEAEEEPKYPNRVVVTVAPVPPTPFD